MPPWTVAGPNRTRLSSWDSSANQFGCHRMIATVLFDLDGLLSDTEPLHCQAYQRALAAHGVRLTEPQYLEHWTRRGLGIGDFVRAHHLPLDPVALRRSKAAHYQQLVAAGCTPMPGALAALARLGPHKTLAVASSAYADAVHAVLGALGIVEHFACIVCGNEVRHVKPAPDIFLLAARKTRTPPRQCVVIEDAEKGVRAAHAAGMRCIAIPSCRTADHDFTLAEVRLESLDALTVELLDAL